jgi:hypothetical protein
MLIRRISVSLCIYSVTAYAYAVIITQLCRGSISGGHVAAFDRAFAVHILKPNPHACADRAFSILEGLFPRSTSNKISGKACAVNEHGARVQAKDIGTHVDVAQVGNEHNGLSKMPCCTATSLVSDQCLPVKLFEAPTACSILNHTIDVKKGRMNAIDHGSYVSLGYGDIRCPDTQRCVSVVLSSPFAPEYSLASSMRPVCVMSSNEESRQEIRPQPNNVKVGDERPLQTNNRKSRNKFSMYNIAHTCLSVGVIMWGVTGILFVLCWIREYYLLHKRYWIVRRLPTAQYYKPEASCDEESKGARETANFPTTVCSCTTNAKTNRPGYVECELGLINRGATVASPCECDQGCADQEVQGCPTSESQSSKSSALTSTTTTVTTRELVLAAAHSMGIHVPADEHEMSDMMYAATPAELAGKAKATFAAKAKTIATRARTMADKAMNKSTSKKTKLKVGAEKQKRGRPAYFDCHRCVVCLEDFIEDEKLVLLPCRHVFHKLCIDPWLVHRSSLCPICKFSIMGQ